MMRQSYDQRRRHLPGAADADAGADVMTLHLKRLLHGGENALRHCLNLVLRRPAQDNGELVTPNA